MAIRLKPLHEQTIVITGASSGIGLVTARKAAQHGARLVLAARSEQDLRQLEEEIKSAGGQAVAVVADVGREEDVRRIVETALSHFGGFDTWVNNAGITIFGRIEDISNEDNHRLFDTVFWGTVYGSQQAVRHLKQHGGALINIGSVVSDRAIPIQGMYSAAKHAVKGFTDALRMELEEEGAPVSVTLIKPTGINTPYTRHATNYMAEEPRLPDPVYPPEEVAHAILHAATRPMREVFVGGASKLLSVMGRYAPRLTDRYMEATMFRQQKRDQPAGHHAGALHVPGGGLSEHGDHPGHVARTSLYTRGALHPMLTGALLGTAGLAIGAMMKGGRKHRGHRGHRRDENGRYRMAGEQAGAARQAAEPRQSAPVESTLPEPRPEPQPDPAETGLR